MFLDEGAGVVVLQNPRALALGSISDSDYATITEVRVSGQGISEMPYQIIKLTNLKVLDLSDNNFESINLSSLDKLEECYLQGNKFDEVPFSVTQMTTLKKLDMSNNQIYKDTYIKDLTENNKDLTNLNLDRNLLEDATLNPNPKKFESSVNVLNIKVGEKFDLTPIAHNFSISGEPLSSKLKNFLLTYFPAPGDTEPYIDSAGIALREGSISGKLHIGLSKTNPNTTLDDFTLNILPNRNILPVITIESETSIFEGESFNAHDGLVISDFEDGDITSSVTISGDTVDSSTPGVYSSTYTVSDSDGGISSKTRTVTVKEDFPAVIHAEDKSIKEGGAFNPMDGVSAFDEVDGDLTSSIVVSGDAVDTSSVGEYSVTYSVTDSKGQATSKTVVINILKDLPPTINVDDKVIIEGSTFNPMAGVSAVDSKDGDLSGDVIVVNNNVVTSLPGVYEVGYSVTDSFGNNTEKTISVSVIEDKGDAPVIKADDISIVLGKEYKPLDGVLATDIEDGDITNKIEVIDNNVDSTKIGEYNTVYKVTDSDGNSSNLTRRVFVVNDEMPTITASDAVILKNSEFNPLQGIKAHDKEDGDLTDKINVIENTVDTSKNGDYKVNYEVSDSVGNITSKEIKVTVKEKIDDSGSSNVNKPQTGDNLAIYGALATISIVGLTITNKKSSNKNTKNEE